MIVRERRTETSADVTWVDASCRWAELVRARACKPGSTGSPNAQNPLVPAASAENVDGPRAPLSIADQPEGHDTDNRR